MNTGNCRHCGGGIYKNERNLTWYHTKTSMTACETTKAEPIEKEMHWFCFSFKGKHSDGMNCDCNACTYVGYPSRNITKKMIDAQKKESGVSESAVLIACTHLGFMTKEKFIGENI